jgi:pyridoxine 5-phosphate synthase
MHGRQCTRCETGCHQVQGFGAEGITVHPRLMKAYPYSDVYYIREIVTTEFNIEGTPE